eukprot:TRINITY_DN3019_c0_g1_i7.p1 TRINITY_DN3019_c0_g1~~TRINITY_DN3019_c0_g1_i7.p1  ORF type:complete len:193 (+),score=38.83 TRINITY_DN3019_c0_g1_i7:409-987(+)
MAALDELKPSRQIGKTVENLHKKYTKHFEDNRDGFAAIVRAITAKEKMYVAEVKKTMIRNKKSIFQSNIFQKESQGSLGESFLGKHVEEIDAQEAIISERQKDLDEIEEAMVQIKEYVLESAQKVDDQGEGLNQINDDLESANSDVKETNENLVEQVKKDKTKFKTRLIIAGSIFVAVVAIALTIYVLQHQK